VTSHLVFVVLVSCVGMVLTDAFGALLNVAENRGRDNLAGLADTQVDFWGKYVLAGWSGSTLTHGHGLVGWLCVTPVLATGFVTTKFATRRLRSLRPAAPEE
jgi:hypothetical protein